MSVSEPQISLDKSKSMEQNVQSGFHRNEHTHTHTHFVWKLRKVILRDDSSRKFRVCVVKHKSQGMYKKTQFYGISFNDCTTNHHTIV